MKISLLLILYFWKIVVSFILTVGFFQNLWFTLIDTRPFRWATRDISSNILPFCLASEDQTSKRKVLAFFIGFIHTYFTTAILAKSWTLGSC